MIFKRISFGSAEYGQECALRDAVLRRPLGLSLYDEDLDKEKDQLHFGLFDAQGRLCGCVVAIPGSDCQAKIRQMAVAPDCRGRGYGSRIISELEAYLASCGFTHAYLHARVSAVGFYRKQGYSVMGDEFVEVTLAHVRMDKQLRPEISGW